MIEIKTPARLHLGLLDTNGNLGRLYGSIGVAIKYPNVILTAEPANSLEVEGPDSERVFAFATQFLSLYPNLPGVHFSLKSNIPSHIGLGSGTQLALAVGSALARLGNLDLSLEKIALVMGRGLHSGIGINAFHQGGFVLDGGHHVGRVGSMSGLPPSIERTVPPVIFHQPVPENWFFVIIVPETNEGISGEKEVAAFRKLPGMPPTHIEKVCRLLLMKMLPALVEKDIIIFGEALTEIQRLVGESFAEIQGGRFANPLSEQLISFLLERGATGAGQSSWGPTVYGLVNGEEAALSLTNEAEKYLNRIGKGRCFSVQPDNNGAKISIQTKNIRATPGNLNMS
jgi:beta-ribofuranosylaminobenzene 5'-phosphate synthase